MYFEYMHVVWHQVVRRVCTAASAAGIPPQNGMRHVYAEAQDCVAEFIIKCALSDRLAGSTAVK